MPDFQLSINPRLVAKLTGQHPEAIDSNPTLDSLPGNYARIISRNLSSIPRQFEPNMHELHCLECGKKGTYDLGTVFVDSPQWKEYCRKVEESKLAPPDPIDYIQLTGYFRCHHCNQAGKWRSDLRSLSLALLTGLLSEEQDRFIFGKYALYDGTCPHVATDGEEHLLDKLDQSKEPAFVWNRLGNMYMTSGRPDLAAVAFEKSLAIDQGQVESHYSLGNLLMYCKEWDQALFHYRRMLIYARNYTKLQDEKMRDLLAAGLQNAFIVHLESDQSLPLPLAQEIADVSGEEMPDTSDTIQLEFDVHPDDTESFYPLAEMYMGKFKSARYTSKVKRKRKKKKRKKR
jgi:tetratricopeptide (TPR) repeat protein